MASTGKERWLVWRWARPVAALVAIVIGASARNLTIKEKMGIEGIRIGAPEGVGWPEATRANLGRTRRDASR